jgi:hypothetical protein
MVVAGEPHIIQNPGDCFVLNKTGLVSKGFIL